MWSMGLTRITGTGPSRPLEMLKSPTVFVFAIGIYDEREEMIS